MDYDFYDIFSAQWYAARSEPKAKQTRNKWQERQRVVEECRAILEDTNASAIDRELARRRLIDLKALIGE